jgi:hypothetical protein
MASTHTHFQLNQPVKIDGVDFEPGVYPSDEIDAGRRVSIVNAGWGDYCDAPKPAHCRLGDYLPAKTNDDDDGDNEPAAEIPTPVKPKPARSRKKPPAK